MPIVQSKARFPLVLRFSKEVGLMVRHASPGHGRRAHHGATSDRLRLYLAVGQACGISHERVHR